jgi:hypothetical protein
VTETLPQVTVTTLAGIVLGQLAKFVLVASTCTLHELAELPPLVAKVIVAVALPATDGLSGLVAEKVIVDGVALLLGMDVAASPAAGRACKAATARTKPKSLCFIIQTMTAKLR